MKVNYFNKEHDSIFVLDLEVKLLKDLVLFLPPDPDHHDFLDIDFDLQSLPDHDFDNAPIPDFDNLLINLLQFMCSTPCQSTMEKFSPSENTVSTIPSLSES